MEGFDDYLLESVSYFDVLEQIQDGVLIVDRDYAVRYWNPAATSILGYPASEVCGWSCRTLGPLCKRDAVGNPLCGEGICPLALAVSGGFSGKYPHYVFMRAADGREIPLSVTVCPLKDPKGAVLGGICAFRDVSEEFGQLRLAGEIQKHMVTTRAFRKDGLKVSTLFRPLEVTGGDYIEAFVSDAGLLIATGADATGHGVSAALFAMIYKALFHGNVRQSYSPAAMLEAINADFCGTNTVEGYYLTAAVAVLDPVTRSGYLAGAGHPPALLFHHGPKGFEATQLKERSYMIGMVEGARYEQAAIKLESGDALLIASDGLYEAEDGDGVPFGFEGAAAFFESGERDLEKLYALLRERNHAGELADDVSALLIEAVD